jgi:hypothetical protein
MTEYEFYKLVSRMRQAQRLYDRMGTSDNLRYMNRLEHEVDQILSTVFPDKDTQQSLF